MTGEANFDETIKPKRSTLLLVLCILSFVGSGFGIISGLGSLAFYSNKSMQGIQQKMEQDQAKAAERMKHSKDSGNAFALKILENTKPLMDPIKKHDITVLQIVGACISFCGALFMFFRRRLGYLVYVAGCLFGVWAYMHVYGTSNIISSLSIVFVGFFSLIFIVLYALCLKEMHW